MMACSTPCFASGNMAHVWHIFEQGYVPSGRCMGVCSPSFPMRGVPITNRLFFCSSPSCVRVHVCRLRGVPCGKLLRVVRRKQRFVSTFESSPAVDLSCCLEGALSDMQLFFFCRGALGGDKDFLLIGTVFDSMCFVRPVFQRVARRMAHCLFVFALRRWSCFCFRRVVASVSEFRQVSAEVHCRGLFHVAELHVGFERCFLEGDICGGENGGRANAGQRFVSVASSFF